MNGLGAHEDDMRFFARLSEREIDSVLAGKAPADDPDLQAVATFFRDVKVGLAETPAAPVEVAHLTRIFAAANESAVFLPEQRISAGVPARRRNPFSSLAARVTIAAVGLAAIAAFGGAAYAGVLPGPVQSKVSDIARNVGISLARSENDPSRGGGGDHGGGTHDRNHQSGRSDGGVDGQGNSDQGPQSTGDGSVEGNSGDQGSPADENGSGQRSFGDGAQATGGEGARDQGDRGPQPDSAQQSTPSEGDPAPVPQEAPSGSDPGGSDTQDAGAGQGD